MGVLGNIRLALFVGACISSVLCAHSFDQSGHGNHGTGSHGNHGIQGSHYDQGLHGHQSHTLITPVRDCGGHICTIHNPACVLHGLNHAECHHTQQCESYSSCVHELLHSNEKCCCTSQTCVDHVHHTYNTPVHHHNSTTSTTGTPQVECYSCPDVLAHTGCTQTPLPCQPGDVCRVRNDGAVVSTQCEQKHRCNVHMIQDNQNSNHAVHTTCCTDLNCTTTAVLQYTKGVTSSLHCNECTDGFSGSCQGDKTCNSNQDCMIQINAGKLVSRCMESTSCKAEQLVIPNTRCCTDTNCSIETNKLFHQKSFQCPFCSSMTNASTCLDHVQTCAPLDQGCYVLHQNNAVTASCENNMTTCRIAEQNNDPLCTSPYLSASAKSNLRCVYCCDDTDSVCLLGAISKGTTLVAPTQTNAPATNSMAPTQTNAPGITSSQTTVSVGSACTDNVISGVDCQQYDDNFAICSHQVGHGAAVAYTECRKTCNHCNDTLPTQISVTTTQPSAGISQFNQPLPSGLPDCLDVNTTMCTHLKDALCSAQDQLTHDFAVMNCSKTCNFCDEFHYAIMAQYTTTEKPTTTTVKTAKSPQSCFQCGHPDVNIPCSAREIFVGALTKCPPEKPYCQTDVFHDLYGNRKVFKRCVNIDTCRREWLQQSSDLDYCVHYGSTTVSGDYSCHFCCTSDGCNTDIQPSLSTLFLKEHV